MFDCRVDAGPALADGQALEYQTQAAQPHQRHAGVAGLERLGPAPVGDGAGEALGARDPVVGLVGGDEVGQAEDTRQ